MTRNLTFFVLLAALLTPSAFAGTVSKVKNQSVLIDLQGDSASPGDSFFTLSDGKKRGIVSITKVRGDKAIAKIVKGKVTVGMTTLARGAVGAKASSASAGGSWAGLSNPKYSRAYWGGMLGADIGNMSAQVYTTNGSVSSPYQRVGMSGIGANANALFDYEVWSQIWFRGLAGIDGLNVSGSASCGITNGNPSTAQTCNATIYYFDVDFLARYEFATGEWRPWLGAGVALLMPVSKSSTALTTSSISVTNVLQVAGGVDYFFSPSFFIPVSVEYGLLPKSADVSASWFAIRVGVGFPF